MMSKKGKASGFLGYIFDHGDAPKNETLEEHKKHCRAEEGNCPFEKKLVEKAGEEDDVGGANPPPAPKPGSEDPAVGLKDTAKQLEAIFRGVAGQIVGKENIDQDLFSVTPTMTWDPVTCKEKPTGGFRLAMIATKGGDKCDSFLNALANDYGVSRKPKDMFPSENGSCRVGTFLTGDEAKSALAKFEDIKKQVAEKAKQDAAKAAAEKATEAQRKAIAMATSVVTDAAKSVNYHVDQGDFAPNKAKVDAALNAKADVQAILDGGSADPKVAEQAQKLMKALGEIEASYYKGEHGKVGEIPPFDIAPQQKKDQSKKPAALPGMQEHGKKSAQGKWYDPEKYPGEAAMLADKHGKLLAAAKTINFHLSQGDTEYNAEKIAAYGDVGTFYDEMFMETEPGTPENDYAKEMLAADGAIKMAIAMKNADASVVKKALKGGCVSNVPAMLGATASAKKNGVGASPALKAFGSKPKGQEPNAAMPEGEAFKTDGSVWGKDYDFTNVSPDQLKGKADALSLEEAEKMLKDPNGPLKGLVGKIISSPSQVSATSKQLTKGHKPLDNQKMFEDSVKMAAVAFSDLKSRFPNIPVPKISVLYPSIPSSPFVGAEFTRAPDGTTAICYHADYNKVSHAGDYSYGHKDSRYPFDVLRHELGHAIGKGEIHKQWKKFLSDTYGFPATGFFQVMKAKVSKYAAACKPGVTTPDIYESLAETFSMITSHDYKAGTLPLPIENFVYTKMLGCPDPKKS